MVQEANNNIPNVEDAIYHVRIVDSSRWRIIDQGQSVLVVSLTNVHKCVTIKKYHGVFAKLKRTWNRQEREVVRVNIGFLFQ